MRTDIDMPIDVVFIAGSGRSGSTLLDRVLGTLPVASSHNELLAVPKRGLGDNQTCSCGSRFRECPFWSQVVQIAGFSEEAVQDMIEQRAQADRLRTFPKIYFGFSGHQFAQGLSRYRSHLASLYRAIAAASGKAVLVDSTKVPTHALILAGIPGIRLHVLHLVRDGRDVAPAWKKRKFDPGTGKPMRYMSPWFVAVSWVLENLFAGMLRTRAPYYRVRYEDFIAQPQRVLDDICQQIAPLRGSRVRLTDGRVAELGTIHAISGNPDRFNTGPTTIGRPGSPERRRMTFSRALALVVGFPLLWRYGYLAGSAGVELRDRGS